MRIYLLFFLSIRTARKTPRKTGHLGGKVRRDDTQTKETVKAIRNTIRIQLNKRKYYAGNAQE